LEIWLKPLLTTTINVFTGGGQSEEGFELLFDKFVFPGQTILDPFVGGGTTAVVALKRGCNFIGIDNDLSALLTTKKRCQALGLDFILKGYV
jgi:site-specific DNA-methyltransferase (adenine-specific)